MLNPRRRRVLHSMRAPGNETRYASHMAALDGSEFEMLFFTWRRALWGHYDIFHVHWPEQLLSRSSGVMGRVRWICAQALIGRLRRRQTPVVYTLHNHAPHEITVSPHLRQFQSELMGLTRLEIHLVPEPGRTTSAATTAIPHGNYREPFASFPREVATQGRLLFFGILKAYKGIGHLLSEFAAVDDSAMTLRLVGEPQHAATVAAIDDAARVDRRVSKRYGFIADADLVSEVSAASLIVLPYTELHSSGAVLVALSLDRPVLLPSSPTADALREEVGARWVHVFSPPLTADDLQRAMSCSPPSGSPNLNGRNWNVVRDAHTAAYRTLLNHTQSSL